MSSPVLAAVAAAHRKWTPVSRKRALEGLISRARQDVTHNGRKCGPAARLQSVWGGTQGARASGGARRSSPPTQGGPVPRGKSLQPPTAASATPMVAAPPLPFLQSSCGSLPQRLLLKLVGTQARHCVATVVFA